MARFFRRISGAGAETQQFNSSPLIDGPLAHTTAMIFLPRLENFYKKSRQPFALHCSILKWILAG